MTFCEKCGKTVSDKEKYDIYEGDRKTTAYLCDDCLKKFQDEGFEYENNEKKQQKTDKAQNSKTLQSKNDKGGNIGCIVGMLIIIVPIIVAIVLSNCTEYSNDKYRQNDTPSYSYDAAPSSPKQKNESKSDTVNSAIKAAMEQAEKDGFIVAQSGYTYEKCVERSRIYLNGKYNENFYDSECFIAYLSSEPFYYDVIGFTKSGKSFDVQIYHNGGGNNDVIKDWVVITDAIK